MASLDHLTSSPEINIVSRQPSRRDLPRLRKFLGFAVSQPFPSRFLRRWHSHLLRIPPTPLQPALRGLLGRTHPADALFVRLVPLPPLLKQFLLAEDGSRDIPRKMRLERASFDHRRPGLFPLSPHHPREFVRSFRASPDTLVMLPS